MIGFCFSFPCDHTSFNSGILLKLTKRFENPGAIGVNPTAALTAAFSRLGVSVWPLPAFAWQSVACVGLPVC